MESHLEEIQEAQVGLSGITGTYLAVFPGRIW
jgi:hypothetical protein